MTSSPEHWDRIFSTRDEHRLGWFEPAPETLLHLLREPELLPDQHVLLCGNGTSRLADFLLGKARLLSILDISTVALKTLAARLGTGGGKLQFFSQNVAAPLPEKLQAVDLWIDRATLHFLSEEKEIEAYFVNLHRVLKTNGYALFAQFSEAGHPECAGLPVHRYSLSEFQNRLGAEFRLVAEETHTHLMPTGDQRPYIHALFHRGS